MTATLPTPGGDNNTWGDELNTFLLVGHNADGTNIAATVGDAKLNGSVVIGATALTIDRSAPAGWQAQNFVLVDAYTANAEIRKVSSASSTTVNLTAGLTYAHSTNAVVILLDDDPYAGMWGAVGNGSADDHDALQAAINSAAAAGLVLNLQNKTYIVSSPILLPNGSQLRDGVIKASASFSPAESTNALGMTQNGNIVQITSADPTTDVITTAVAHGLPGTGIGVVFQGASLPAGLVAGRFYYVTARTSTTSFTVSETSGGTNTDITGTGTGTAYCEVYAANIKSFLRHVTFEANLVASLNGLMVSCQQQTTWDTVRVNNAPGFGIKVKGQQADWRNIEIINCGIGLEFDNMSFLYVKDLNIESCTTSAMKCISTNGLVSSSIIGLHIENLDSAGTFCDFSAFSCQNCLFQDVSISGLGTDSASWVGFDMGTAGTVICTYEIRRLRFPTASTSTNNVAVRDNYRGKTIIAYTGSSTDSADREIGSVTANDVPASASFSDAYVGHVMWGVGGKEIRFGRQQNISPVLELTPGSAQTADSLIVKDTSGTQQFGLTKDGQVKSALAVQEGIATPTYGTTVAINARSGDWQKITVTDAVAFTISAPTNPPDSTHSQSLTIEILNSAGGAMGAITWNTAFVMPGGAFTNPASTLKRFVRFEWNGTKWVETSRAGADY